jgi:ABC-type polysaccharide/polyol phosphate transport system ATPase subunit
VKESIAVNDDNASPLNSAREEKPSTVLGRPAIQLEDISLCFQRRGLFMFARNKDMRKSRKFWALKNVSLTICEGETIGVIGRNGSGKSTISRVFSGALPPDQGEIHINGKVQLLALGIGFRPAMSGRENVMISGSILGLSRREIRDKMDEIEEFAELGDFFDEPIRTYSAGMKSRLGFAISTAVNPDILILDEVMSTGDASFRKKANERMAKMRELTKTVIIVSHSPGQLRELCSRVIWFEKGRLIMDGKVDEVLQLYGEFCKNPLEWVKNNPELINNGAFSQISYRQQ